MIETATREIDLSPQYPKPLFLYALFYGGMTCIAGVLGAKQVALGPLAVEAGIFPFLLLVSISSSVAQLYGQKTATQMVRFGFVPLIGAMALTAVVLTLPTDEDMWEPAKEAFPIVLGQTWQLWLAGILAYGISMTLNVLIFSRLARFTLIPLTVRGAIASIISQVIDTVIFITVGFFGQRPLFDLIVGQALSKVVLSIVLVPFLISALVRFAKWMEQRG
ncbi:queuosine precursor transporter [Croceicoccus sp. Ery5]|uniref:queuosine precursor transporter n=1 Tax=Croceicoccus sp. Ery5 TaxID=1703340 RepID=UPI001E5C31AE|nr:queuosine precursor transporter [Croceicoccus sp. Ery5]